MLVSVVYIDIVLERPSYLNDFSLSSYIVRSRLARRARGQSREPARGDPHLALGKGGKRGRNWG